MVEDVRVFNENMLVLRGAALEKNPVPLPQILKAVSEQRPAVKTHGLLGFGPYLTPADGKARLQRLESLGFRRGQDAWDFPQASPGWLPPWVSLYVYARSFPSAKESIAGVHVNEHYGIVIRQATLHEHGVFQNQLLGLMEVDQPFDESTDLISFGPHFGGEAAEAFVHRLKGLGLQRNQDLFVFAADWPDWAGVYAALTAAD